MEGPRFHVFKILLFTGTWSSWTNTPCSATCGGGVRNRTRTCTGGTCSGIKANINQACNEQDCPAPAPCPPMAQMAQLQTGNFVAYSAEKMRFDQAGQYCEGLDFTVASITNAGDYAGVVWFLGVKNKLFHYFPSIYYFILFFLPKENYVKEGAWVDVSNPISSSSACSSASDCNNKLSDSAGKPISTDQAYGDVVATAGILRSFKI